MQQYAVWFILLQNHSTCFGCPPHPSSGVLKTVTAASGAGHNSGTATSLQLGQVGTGLCTNVAMSGLACIGSATSNLAKLELVCAQTSPDLATLEGSSCTAITTCTGGCGYSF